MVQPSVTHALIECAHDMFKIICLKNIVVLFRISILSVYVICVTQWVEYNSTIGFWATYKCHSNYYRIWCLTLKRRPFQTKMLKMKCFALFLRRLIQVNLQGGPATVTVPGQHRQRWSIKMAQWLEQCSSAFNCCGHVYDTTLCVCEGYAFREMA